MSKRLFACIKYGVGFLLILLSFYLLYVRDVQVLNGILTQQNKFAKNFYIIITLYAKNVDKVLLNKTLLSMFVIVYFFSCVTLLFNKKAKWYKEMRIANYFICGFLFLLITNFQPWYIMWLFPLIIWQKPIWIRLIPHIAITSQLANAVFFIEGEYWKYGEYYTYIILAEVLLCLGCVTIKKYVIDIK